MNSQAYRNLRILLGIRSPDETGKRVAQFVVFLICFFGPLVAFLRVGSSYVLLDENLYFGLLYVLGFFFVASYSMPALKRWLRDWPPLARLLARIGWCMPVVAAVFVVALAVNCVNVTTMQTRDVACLAKRASFGSKPVYYVRVRPWPDKTRDVEIAVPRQVFGVLRVGGGVRITTGVGRLGVEWIRRVDALAGAPSQP